MILALHVPLALAVHSVPYVGLAHKVITSLYVLRLGFRGQNRVVMLCAGAYVIGAEALWRMVDAPGPWEVGKYLLIAMFGWAMLRRREWFSAGLPALFGLLLLPSIAMYGTWPFKMDIRNALGNDLSGPLALAVTGAFCAKAGLTRAALGRILVWMIAPVVSVLMLCVSGTVGAGDLTFRTSSIDATSGGFGPNQVAAVLGYGMAASLLVALGERGAGARHAGLAGLALAFGAQSALTFSRGGLYNAGGALLCGLFPLVASSRYRGRAVVVMGIAAVVGVGWVAPRLVEFTDGAITKRFSNTSLTHRELIIAGDLMLFAQYPLLGVGPGVSPEVRPLSGRRPHTEYSRLLAEHGVLGALAICLLAVMVVRAVAGAKGGYAKATAILLSVWTLLYMTNAAMRLAAPAFMFGLALCRMQFDEAGAPAAERQAETPVLTAGRHRRSRRHSR